jgi:DNA-binding response OmpR family regulator
VSDVTVAAGNIPSENTFSRASDAGRVTSDSNEVLLMHAQSLVSSPASVARSARRAGAEAAFVRREPETRDTRILLVDADPEALDRASIQMLRQQAFAIEQARAVDEASAVVAAGGVDLILLETDLGGAPTLPFCLEASLTHKIPVVIFSARAEPMDTVAAFEFGARDCIAKSAHPLEFLARTRAVLRHANPVPTDVRNKPSWRFDQADGSLTGPSGRTIYLAPSAAAVLRELVVRPGAILDRATLADLLFGTPDAVETRAVDVRITRLRRTLDHCDGAGRMIQTRRPIGYVFNARVLATGDQQLTITLDS